MKTHTKIYVPISEFRNHYNLLRWKYRGNGVHFDAGSLERNAINIGSGSTRERNFERLRQMRSGIGQQMESGRSLGLLDSDDAQGFRLVPEAAITSA